MVHPVTELDGPLLRSSSRALLFDFGTMYDSWEWNLGIQTQVCLVVPLDAEDQAHMRGGGGGRERGLPLSNAKRLQVQSQAFYRNKFCPLLESELVKGCFGEYALRTSVYADCLYAS